MVPRSTPIQTIPTRWSGLCRRSSLVSIETIDYTTRALRDGGYTSTVHIDATAINGTGYDTMDAAAYIEITRTGVAAKTFRYGGWEPPAWNLSAPEPGLNMDPELELEVESGIEG